MKTKCIEHYFEAGCVRGVFAGTLVIYIHTYIHTYILIYIIPRSHASPEAFLSLSVGILQARCAGFSRHLHTYNQN